MVDTDLENKIKDFARQVYVDGINGRNGPNADPTRLIALLREIDLYVTSVVSKSVESEDLPTAVSSDLIIAPGAGASIWYVTDGGGGTRQAHRMDDLNSILDIAPRDQSIGRALLLRTLSMLRKARSGG